MKRGDTLSDIGRQYGKDWRNLAKWSGINNPNVIHPGQSIRLGPKSKPTVSRPAKKKPTVTTTQYKPKQRTPFSQVMPFDKVFKPDLINNLATSQLRPEINRNKREDLRNLNRGLARSGAYRTGHAGLQRQNLADAYSRNLKEQRSSYTNQMRDWLTNWYNQQSQNYYRNPVSYTMPTLPSYDEFTPSLASVY